VVCAVHYYKNYRTSNCWGQVGWLGKAEGRDYEVLFSCCTARQAAKYSGQLHLQFLCSLRCILSSEAAHFVACIEIGYDMLHNYISTPHSCTFTNIWFSCYACTTHVYWPSGSDTAGSIIDPVLFFGCFRCKPAVEVEQRSSAISRANLLLTRSHCVGAFLRHNG
jgi:hypothetical protein